MNFPLNILSWNTRGELGKGRKQGFLRFLNRKYGLYVSGIVEMKKGIIDDFLMQRLWVNSDFAYSFVP